MGSIRQLGRYAFRKYVLDGVSASGFNKPTVDDIFPFVDAIDALPQGYQVSYESRNAPLGLYGDLNWGAGSIGRVFGDATEAYKGVYKKSGAPGAGSWTRIGPLPGGDISGIQSQVDALSTNKLNDSSATNRLLGRRTSGAGPVEQLAPTRGLSIDVDGVGLANMPQATVKGRVAGGGTGSPTDMTMTQLKVAAALENVANLAPINYPISTATAAAIAELDNQFNDANATTGIGPLASVGDDVVLWHVNGSIGGKGFTEEMRTAATSDIATTVEAPGWITPLYAIGSDLVLWLEGAKLGAAGLTSDLITLVKGVLSGYFAPRASSSPVPVSTGGETLWRMRDKFGRLKRGGVARPKVSFTGDSWAEGKTIPEAMRSFMAGLGYTVSDAPGWVGVDSVNSQDALASAIFSRAGSWTRLDGSTLPTAYPYGAGMDGGCLWTSTATESVKLANAKATNFTIYYWKAGGTFRYRVDSGSWTVVTTDSSLTLGRVIISGLSLAAHTIDIDTTGNAGVVSILGLYATSPAENAVEVIKWGNGGSTGRAVLQYSPYMAPILADVMPDFVAVLLGTNDHRGTSSTPAYYADGLTAIIDAVRTANGDAGIALLAPPRNGGVPVLPISAYRDKAYQVAMEKNVDFVAVHDLWPDYAPANAVGLWSDLLHLTTDGSRLLLDQVNTKLLKL